MHRCTAKFQGLLLCPGVEIPWRFGTPSRTHLATLIWKFDFLALLDFSQELVRMQMLKGMFWEAFLKRPLHCLHGQTISLQAQANLCSLKVDRIMHVSPQAWRLLLGRSLQQGSLPGGFDFS